MKGSLEYFISFHYITLFFTPFPISTSLEQAFSSFTTYGSYVYGYFPPSSLIHLRLGTLKVIAFLLVLVP